MMTETPETQTISSRMSIPQIARRLSIGRQSVYAMLEQGLLTTSARQSRLQWRRRLVVDILATLNARPNGIRQHLRKHLHLGRGVWRVNEPGWLPPNGPTWLFCSLRTASHGSSARAT